MHNISYKLCSVCLFVLLVRRAVGQVWPGQRAAVDCERRGTLCPRAAALNEQRNVCHRRAPQRLVSTLPRCKWTTLVLNHCSFRRGSRTGGFLWALRFPPPSKLKKILIGLLIGSSEGRFRSRDERNGQKNVKCE
jgi:hypothetical protein